MFQSIKKTSLCDCLELETETFMDNRGSFTKIFHADFFQSKQINFCLKELCYSQSKLNVLRGMHFQSPPAHHSKIIFCPAGKILDVVVDLRRNTPTFGQYYSLIISAEKKNALYVPEGLAHGFLSLDEGTTVVYMVSSVHDPANDTGFRYDSFGFDWGIKKPILSERDEKHPAFDELPIFFQDY